MQIKNNFNLSAKKLFALLIISALIGGGIIYLTFDNISKGTISSDEPGSACNRKTIRGGAGTGRKELKEFIPHHHLPINENGIRHILPR